MDKEHKDDRQVKTENWESGAVATGLAKTAGFHFSSTLLCLCSLYITSRKPKGKVEVHLYASLTSALDGVDGQHNTIHQPHYSQERSKVGPWVGVKWCGKSCHHRSSKPNRPARSRSLYRLRYPGPCMSLTFWRRNYFFLILAHPVYKMWIIQEPNTLDLWNKLYFEKKKAESKYHV